MTEGEERQERKDTGFPIKNVGNDRRGVEDDRRGEQILRDSSLRSE